MCACIVCLSSKIHYQQLACQLYHNHCPQLLNLDSAPCPQLFPHHNPRQATTQSLKAIVSTQSEMRPNNILRCLKNISERGVLFRPDLWLQRLQLPSPLSALFSGPGLQNFSFFFFFFSNRYNPRPTGISGRMVTVSRCFTNVSRTRLGLRGCKAVL